MTQIANDYTDKCLECKGDGRIMVRDEDRTKLRTYRCNCLASNKWSDLIPRWANENNKAGWIIVTQF